MRTYLIAITLCFAAFSLQPQVISAGEIRGNIVASSGEAKIPARYVVRGSSSKTSSGNASGMVAVAIEPLDKSAPPHVPDSTFTMAQENTAFVPNLLIVPLGAVVTFPNHDAFFHNVFSYSPPHSFDLGRYPKGQTRTVRFDEAGIVRIFCEIHASMFATILVAPSDHYQVINAADGFSFPNLPNGHYRVVAVDAAGRKAKTEINLQDTDVNTVSLVLE